MDGDVLGFERRRRWSEERKREIVRASFAPGALVKDVARRHDVAISLVFAWRRAARQAALKDGAPFGSGLGGTGGRTKATVSFLPIHIPAEDAGVLTSPESNPSSAPASCADPAIALTPTPLSRLPGWMEITLSHGRTIKVDASVDADALRRIVDALELCQ
ncbi:MAG: transposase [Hyphomicrobiales bacterium]|nr:transposase [Hyphomicrobiales bacterium]MDE2114300.1 transposase [Hyphomicrobiales bacterium]